ncbi:MAG: 50S ribosomal protein L9 [Bacteroidetes bacterium]|nr:50S ribosomal protein L9 [Bacteroidota bacterium]
MEVILKQDIEGLGYTNDLVVVKNGYGRNFLIPKGKAILATESNKKVRNEAQKQKSFKEERVVKEAETLAKALENISVNIGAKAGTSGKIFGSVNALQLADAIKKQHKFDIDRKKISVDGDSIKELGSYKASIKLHKNISVEINFEVIAE